MDFEKKKRLIPPFYKLDDAVLAVKRLDSYESHTHTTKEQPALNFVQVGDENAPAILFIHGSPGSWEAWAEYLHDPDLNKNYMMVAVDRPGYGGSDNGVSGTSLEDQAKAIKDTLIHCFPYKKQWIVVGHSYGGPIALRLMVDYPKFVSSSLLLAPAISSKLVRVRWYNKLASLPIVRTLIPTALRRSNHEMYLLPDELLHMQAHLYKVKQAVKVIQGNKDGIVHPDNAVFADKELINAEVETTIIPQRGHFLPWEEYEVVKKTILAFLKRSE